MTDRLVMATQSTAVRASQVAEAVLQAAPPGHSLSSRRAAVSRAPVGVGYAGHWQDRLRLARRSDCVERRELVGCGRDQLSRQLRAAVVELSLVQARSRDPCALAH